MSVSLNRLLTKCTMAVAATAISGGKNNTNAGVSIVPSPKPLKKVSIDAPKATAITMAISMEGENSQLSLFEC